MKPEGRTRELENVGISIWILLDAVQSIHLFNLIYLKLDIYLLSIRLFIRKNLVESVGNRLIRYLEKYAAITTEENRKQHLLRGNKLANQERLTLQNLYSCILPPKEEKVA